MQTVGEIDQDLANRAEFGPTSGTTHAEAESERLLHRALLDITRRFKADASQFVVYDAVNDVLISYALTEGGRIIPHPEGFPTTISAIGSGCFAVLQGRREPRLYDQNTESELFWPGTLEYHQKFGTRTVLVVPVHFGERFAGYMGLAYRHSEGPGPEDRPLLAALSHQAAIATELVRLSHLEKHAVLDRIQVVQALERTAASERRALMLKAIADASRDLQNAVDFEHGLQLWLRRVAETAGADAAGLGDYVVSGSENRVVPRIRAVWTSARRVAMDPGREFECEVPETRDFSEWTAKILRGETVWATLSDLADPASRHYWEAEGCAGHVLVPVRLVGDANGFMSFDFFSERPYDGDLVLAIQTAAEGLGAAVRRHATHQAQLAERDDYAARVRKSNAALQATVDALSGLDTIDTFLPRVVGIVAQAFDAIGVGYFEHTDETIWHRFWLDDGKVLAATELPNLDPQHLKTAQLLADGFWCPPEHLGVDIRERTRPSIVHHSAATASPHLHAFCVARGWHWELNVPLFVGGRTDAAIVLYHEESRPFTESDVVLAESLAKQISLAREVGRLGEVERKAAILVERAQAGQARVALLERANVALQQSVDLFSRIGRMSEAVPGVLHIAAAAFGADYCAYCEYVDGRICVRHWYWEGQVLAAFQLPELEPPQPAFIRRLAEGFIVQGNKLAADAINRKRPYVVDHRNSVGDPDVRRFRSVRGWDLELNIPLVVDDRNVGGLMIFRSAQSPFNDDEIALGSSLGKQLALAMQVTAQAEREREMAVARERVAELSKANIALRESLDSLASAPDLDEFLGHVLRIAAKQAGVELAHLWVHDDQGWVTLRLGYCQGEVFGPGAFHRMPLAEIYLKPFQVPIEMTGGEPLHARTKHFVQDLFSSPYVARVIGPETLATYRRLGVQNEINVPLRFSGRCIAHLAVYLAPQREIREELVELISALGNQAILAMEMTRLAGEAQSAAISREREQAARSRADDLAKANQVLKQTLDFTSSEPNLKKVLGHVLRAISQQLQSESSALWLLDEHSKRFKPHLIWNVRQIIEVNGESMPSTQGNWGRGRDLAFKTHIQERRPIVYDVAGFRDSNPTAYDYFMRLGVSTMLGVPLLMGDDVVGSLTVRFGSARGLTEEELTLTQAMAHQATMAIQLTRLAEQANVAAIAEERARFARDVHDTLAQGFTGILMQIGAASQVSGNDRDRIAPHLDAIANLARSSLAEARRSVRELRRISPIETQLEDRINQLVARMRLRASAPIDLQIEGAGFTIPSRVQTELLGITQEGIMNAIKHSSCTKIRVCVDFNSPIGVRIAVKDDGVGFDSAKSSIEDKFGLLGMQERAVVIGASFTIVTERGRGTEIVVQYLAADHPA